MKISHTHTHTHTHTYIKEYYSAMKIMNFAILYSMDVLGGYYAKVSQRKTNAVCYHLCVDCKKIQKTSKYNKK